MGQVIANVIAGIAVLLSVLTWLVDRRRGKRSEDRQKELDEAHDVLKQRQLLLDEQMLEFARQMRRQADVRATLKRQRPSESVYFLTLRNAGQGPALGVQATVEGYLASYSDPIGLWDFEILENDDTRRFITTVPERPIERLDPESQPFIIKFKAEPSFLGPVSLTLSWWDSGDEEKQAKIIDVTPHNS